MSHIVFLRYATPKGHKEFEDVVNKRISYHCKGKLRTGDHKPLLSEVKVYDIRVKKQLVPVLMRDLGIKDYKKGRNKGWYSGHFQLVISRLLQVGRRLLGMKTVTPAPGTPGLTLHGWQYNQLIGIINDLVDDDEEAL